MTNETNGQAIITVQQLRSKGACGEQVELFQSVWGDRVDVEEAEFLKHATQFDWAWGADALLPLRSQGSFRGTEESWYGTWQDRSNEYAKPAYDAYRALKQERREKADIADREGKYDEVYDSYGKPIDAANDAQQKARYDGQAIWFARLYREACGITTDEWQIKERESGTEGITDADADSAAAASPAALEPLAVVGGEVDAVESAGDSGDSDAAVYTGEPTESTEGSGREV